MRKSATRTNAWESYVELLNALDRLDGAELSVESHALLEGVQVRASWFATHVDLLIASVKRDLSVAPERA